MKIAPPHPVFPLSIQGRLSQNSSLIISTCSTNTFALLLFLRSLSFCVRLICTSRPSSGWVPAAQPPCSLSLSLPLVSARSSPRDLLGLTFLGLVAGLVVVARGLECERSFRGAVGFNSVSSVPDAGCDRDTVAEVDDTRAWTSGGWMAWYEEEDVGAECRPEWLLALVDVAGNSAMPGSPTSSSRLESGHTWPPLL